MNYNTQVKENLNAHMGRWVNLTKALEFILCFEFAGRTFSGEKQQCREWVQSE